MSKRIQPKMSGFSEASFYIGLVSLVEELLAVANLSITAIIAGVILSAVAVVFGILGLRQVKMGRMDGKWLAITGIVFGVIGIAVLPFYYLIWLPEVQRVATEGVNKFISQ